MRKLSSCWVTVDQKHTRRTLLHADLNHLEEGSAKFLQRFATMDETWVNPFTKDTYQQS